MTKGLHKLYKSVWLFPAVLTLVLLLLTAFRISGSSVGMYNTIFGLPQHGKLLANQPQPVRSDEWLVTTQLIVAQAKNNYPRFNDNIGSGRDMTLDADVPYKEWSVAFKPQNLIFFVLPLEYAFAFKWWLLLYLVLLSCYFLTLRVLHGKRPRLTATLVALATGFSPFLFWWYQTATLAPMFYGFFIAIMVMRLAKRERIKLFGKAWGDRVSTVVQTLLLGYLIASLGILIYPPFQIPIIIVLVALFVGYTIDHFVETPPFNPKRFGVYIAPFAVAALIGGGVVGLFIGTRLDAVHSLSNTAYPGHRFAASGGFESDRVLTTFLQPQLQRQKRGDKYYQNQSESSSFILLLPYLVLPGFVLLAYQWRTKRTINATLLCLQLCALLFLANLFLPLPDILTKLTLLNIVPHNRSLIGLGFLGILQLIYFIRTYTELAPSKEHKQLQLLTGGYVLLCFIVALLSANYVRHHFPLYISSWPLIILAAGYFCLMIFALLRQRFILTLAMLAALSVGSVIKIHPLYVGLQPLVNNPLNDAISALSKEGDTWVTLDNITTENLPELSDRRSSSGVQPYPDTHFWQQVDGTKDNYIYNRYAHVLFSSSSELPPLKLFQPDLFVVKLDCSEFILKQVDYVASEHQLELGCSHLMQTVKMPGRIFYLYALD